MCVLDMLYTVNLRNVHSALRPQAAFGGMRMPSPAVGGGHRGVTYETPERSQPPLVAYAQADSKSCVRSRREMRS